MRNHKHNAAVFKVFMNYLLLKLNSPGIGLTSLLLSSYRPLCLHMDKQKCTIMYKNV